MLVNRLESGQSNSRQMFNKVRSSRMREIGCQVSKNEWEECEEEDQKEQQQRVGKRQYNENYLKKKVYDGNVDVNVDGTITRKQNKSKYDVDERSSNNLDNEKTKNKQQYQLEFTERSALSNHRKSAIENDECSANTDKKVTSRNSLSNRYDGNCKPSCVNCNNTSSKDDICSSSSNANGQCVLFEANLPVLIKLHEREENVRYLGVTVLAGNNCTNTSNSDSVNYFLQNTTTSSNNSNTNGNKNALQSSSGISTDIITIRITDTTNPFLLFELEIHEEDYMAFKQRLELLVDFATFPSYLVNLLCNVQQEEMPYKMTFTVHRGDANRATLRVIEPTQFKTVEHLSLQLIKQGDVGQKHYLAERFQHFANALACSERQYERARQEAEKEIALLREELRTLHDEYDTFREGTNVNAVLADKEHVANLAHERELFHSELTRMQISYEDKLHTAERTAAEKEHKLSTNIKEKDEILRQLREEKEKATSELTLLRSQLRLVEETNSAQDKELQMLRQTNAELANFKTEATRAMSTNEISYVSLTERLHAASSSLRNREDELASLRASYEKQDKYIHMLTEQNEQLKEQGKNNEQALGKTHHIISHQLETIKRIKERHKITLNQLHSERALLRDRNNTLEQVQRELVSVNNQIDAYSCKNKELEEELERCNEARERLSTELQQTQAALLHIQKSNVTSILSNGVSSYYNNNGGVSLASRRYGTSGSLSALPLTTATFARVQSNSYPAQNIPYHLNPNTHNTDNNIFHSYNNRNSNSNQSEQNKSANYNASEIPLVSTTMALKNPTQISSELHAKNFSTSPIVSSPASVNADNINKSNYSKNNMGLTVETSTTKSNSKVSHEASNDCKVLYGHNESQKRSYNVNYGDADKVVVDVTRALTNKENCSNNKKYSNTSTESAQFHNNNMTYKHSEILRGANSSVNLLEEFNKNATETLGNKNSNNINGKNYFERTISNDKSNNDSSSVDNAERTAIGITCERNSTGLEILNKDKYAQPALFAVDKSHINVVNTNKMNKSTNANANVNSKYLIRANEHRNASVSALASSPSSSKPPSSFVTQGSGAKTRSRPLLQSKSTSSSNEGQKETAANGNVPANNVEHKQMRGNRLAAKSFFVNQHNNINESSTLQEQAVSAYFEQH